MQSLYFTQLEGLLRLPLNPDWLGVGLMPNQHEQADAILQLAKRAAHGQLLCDRVAFGREGIADSPLRPHRISGKVP